MKRRHAQRGISLVELMVSLVLGVILIGGALSVYINGRATYTLNETIARMQENANFALKYIEQDVRLAGLWGTHNQVASIGGRANDNPLPAANLPGNDCAPNWSINLDAYVEGVNGAGALPAGWACIAEYLANTDVMAIRRVNTRPVATADLRDGQLYVRTSINPQGQIFEGNAQPGGFAPDARNFELLARAYYVSPNSLAGDDTIAVPALRRVELVSDGAAPTLRDGEIVNGIENFQVQFGIRNIANPQSGAVAYVNPDSALLNPGAGNTIVSVRVWVLVRSEQPETGYVDGGTYVMGDVEFTPPRFNEVRDYRRLLVTRTFDIRNRI